jgi:tetratricopeptide (TPR) repeat protein
VPASGDAADSASVDTFVGRDDELAALAAARTRARQGRRQVIVLSGDAGVGKTWLCERSSEQAEHDGFEVVWGRCWPHGGAPALWPWAAVLPQLTGTQLVDAEGPDPERFARFAAVAELLTTSRRDRPTMIVIDDLHNADASTLLFTRFLTHALDRLPLVLVLATRPYDELAELRHDATTISLHPFDLTDTENMLAAHGLADASTARVLFRATGGRPLYLAQAVGHGLTGQDVIAGALARLTSPVRRILAYAALLGVDGTAGEVAELVGESPAAVVEAVATSGLLDRTDDGWRFHDLVREAALAVLDPTEQLDAHAAAADLLAATGNPERIAHHALSAAARSTKDAEKAIAACRTAAASLCRGYAYEQAADLLDRAVALAAHIHTLPSRAELLIERADALLACGRLVRARAAFDEAASAAAHDPVLHARAVLGLGGVWVHEHRNATVRQRVLAQQRAALRALPSTARVLRSRLSVRLAAEAVYEGAPEENVLGALAVARSVGDDRALAEALSLTHHAFLAPEHAAFRLSLAEEQIRTASAAGDGILALFGLLWLTADRYLLGDPNAAAALTELRQRSAAMGIATTGFIVTCMDVMRLIRAGNLAEAEEAALPCLQRGLEVGDADATGYYAAQLLAIRWLQGRDAELADLVAGTMASASLAVPEHGFRVSMAMVLARSGRAAEARAALKPLLDTGIARLQRSSTWLTAMVGFIEVAAILGEPDMAAEAAELARPFSSMPAMPSLAVACIGSVSRALGIAALTLGDIPGAVAYLSQAVEDNLRLGHRPAVAVSRAQLASALITRDEPGDLASARALLLQAADSARDMDMEVRAADWSAAAEALLPAVLRRTSSGWSVHIGQSGFTLPDLVGVRYLSVLLARPSVDVPVLDLVGAGVVDGRQEVLDSAAVEAYRRRLRDLDVALLSASETDGERLRTEKDALVAELTRAVGLGGRIRGFPDSPERARTAVRKAIKRALDVITEEDPVVGQELRDAVTTGLVCRYTPGRHWRVG